MPGTPKTPHTAPTDGATPSQRPNVRLHGHIRNKAGQPIAGATVRIRDGNAGNLPGDLKKLETDGAGTYSADLPAPGEYSQYLGEAGYQIIVSAPGYSDGEAMYPSPFSKNDGAVDPIVLTRPGSVRGIVRSDDGHPLIAEIELPPSHAKTRSGEDGRFVLTDVPEGELWACATAVGHRPARNYCRLAVLEGETAILDFTLVRGSRVEGTVQCESGEVVPGIRVRAYQKSPTYLESLNAGGWGESDRDGHFAIDGLRPGATELVVILEGNNQKRGLVGRAAIDLPERGVAHQDLVLQAPSSIEGVVTDAKGVPIRACVVRTVPRPPHYLEPWSGTGTAPEGGYVLEGLVQDTYSVEVIRQKTSYHQVPLLVVDDVEVGPGSRHLDIRLPEEGSIGGTMTADGAPVDEGTVIVMARARPGHVSSGPAQPDPVATYTKRITAQTNARGEFRVESLPPGTYFVFVEGTDGYSLARRVELNAGEHVKGIEIDAREESAYVRGRVVGPGGEPLAATGIMVRAVDVPLPQQALSTITDRLGRFRMGPLPAGVAYEIVSDEFGRGLKLAAARLGVASAKLLPTQFTLSANDDTDRMIEIKVVGE